MSITARQIADVLGGYKTLGRRVNSTRDLEDIVHLGIPKPALDQFIHAISNVSSSQEQAVQLRNKIVPRATYQRATRLNLQVSETTERLARIYALVLSVFEDERAAQHFIMTPHPELDGRAPFDVALTEVGGRAVEEVIERGLHGLPA